jgi:RNA polymerase sigma factor (sigma-70 family)
MSRMFNGKAGHISSPSLPKLCVEFLSISLVYDVSLSVGGLRPIELDVALEEYKGTSDLIAIDDALQALPAIDPRKSKVVELRFFGGLSVEETAEALRISTDTVLRDWRFAKSWLLRELSPG